MREYLRGQPAGPAGAGAELIEVVVAPREEFAGARERERVQCTHRHLHHASLAQRLHQTRHAHVLVAAEPQPHVVALPKREHLTCSARAQSIASTACMSD